MMKRFSCAAFAVGSVLAIGCATDDDDIDTVESFPHVENVLVKPGNFKPTSDFNLALAFRTHTGEKVVNNTFAAKGSVFIATAPINAATTVQARDWMFQIIDGNGNVISKDPFQCRTFHVAENGMIDRVAAASDGMGKNCTHAFVATNVNGALLLNLMPFADVKADAKNDMVFTVMAAPKAKMWPEAGVVGTFNVRVAPDQQTCVCGNGVVEPTEECDDGNTLDGDGCSRNCVTEDVTGTDPQM